MSWVVTHAAVADASSSRRPSARVAVKGLLLSTSSSGFAGFGLGAGAEADWLIDETLRAFAEYSATAASMACDCVAGTRCQCDDGSAHAAHAGVEYRFLPAGLSIDVGGDLGFVRTSSHWYQHSRAYSAAGWRSKTGSRALARFGLSVLLGNQKRLFDPYGGIDFGWAVKASRSTAFELFARAEFSLDLEFGVEAGLGFLF